MLSSKIKNMSHPIDPELAGIENIPLFEGLSESELANLIKVSHERLCSAREFFFMQGEPADRMFVLTDGRIKLSQVGEGGQQVLIHVITPVHLFALVAMTSMKFYPVSAQAAQDSRAIYWTRQEIMEFVLQYPVLAMNAMRIMAEQVIELQERFREATTERVDHRLARTLMRLAGQSGRKIEEGILIDLPITRQDLAEMSGTTLYTASRLLSQWELQGLVILRRKKVIVRFPHELVGIIES